MKVFLGGTVNGSNWRQRLIPMLKVAFFDPVVSDWNAEAMAREEREKAEATFRLYVITPRLHGVFSIVEAVDDSNKYPARTIFCVLEEDDEHVFTRHQQKALRRTAELIARNGATVLHSLEDVAEFLNHAAQTA